jgi:hypothetical protein
MKVTGPRRVAREPTYIRRLHRSNATVLAPGRRTSKSPLGSHRNDPKLGSSPATPVSSQVSSSASTAPTSSSICSSTSAARCRSPFLSAFRATRASLATLLPVASATLREAPPNLSESLDSDPVSPSFAEPRWFSNPAGVAVFFQRFLAICRVRAGVVANARRSPSRTSGWTARSSGMRESEVGAYFPESIINSGSGPGGGADRSMP